MLREKDPKLFREHTALMSKKLMADTTKMISFDRDMFTIVGNSPIKGGTCTMDLYGVKSGLAHFNPIMVENVQGLPKLEEVEDVNELKKMGLKHKPWNPSANVNMKRPDKSQKGARKTSRGKSPGTGLVVTNKRVKFGNDDKGKDKDEEKGPKPLLPGSFQSKIAEFKVEKDKLMKRLGDDDKENLKNFIAVN